MMSNQKIISQGVISNAGTAKLAVVRPIRALGIRSLLIASTALAPFGMASVPALAAGDEAFEEIVVFARKRSESVQAIPIAVSVVPSELMEDGQLDEVSDFLELVPTATFTRDSDTSSEISIRGSGRNINDEDPSVGVYRDGVYIGGLLFSTSNLFDLAQVEILRGPQAGLYGRNAVGGAINITSAKPVHKLEGTADVRIGSKQRQEYRAVLNVPIIQDKWAVRVAGMHIDQDKGFDYIVNQDQYTDAVDNKTVRVRSLYTPNENWEFLTTVEYFKNDGGGGLMVMAPDAEVGYLDRYEFFEVPGTSPDETDEQLRNGKQISKLKQVQAIQEVNWNTDLGTLTGLVSYRSADYESWRDEDNTVYDIKDIAFDSSQDSLFAELRFASKSFDGFKFMAGVNYMDEDTVLNFENRIGGLFAGAVGGASIADLYAAGVVTPEWAPVFSALAHMPIPVGTPISMFGFTPFATGWTGYLGDTFPTEYINEQSLKSVALFLEANYEVTDRIDIWANLRYTRDRKSIDFAQEFTDECPVACGEIFAAFFGGLDPVILGEHTSRTFSNVSPGGGVNFQVSDNFLAYAKVVTGFKAGGFNAISGSVEYLPFDEEKTISYEIGAKSDWLDHRLRVNVAAFFQKRKDTLVRITDPVMPIQALGVNAGEIENKGFEVEVVARPVGGLQIQTAFGYLDATFKDFGIAGNDYAGNRVPGTFKYTMSTVVSYTHRLTDELDLFSYAFYRNAWQGYTDNNNIEKMSNPEVVDIRLGVKSDRWKLLAYVDNLFDNRYTVAENRPMDNGDHNGIFSPGRTYGINGAINF